MADDPTAWGAVPVEQKDGPESWGAVPVKSHEPEHPGALAAAPDDSGLAAAGKGTATAAIKGLAGATPISYATNAGNLADYLLARAHAKITGKPVEEVMAGYEAARKAAAEGSALGRVREGIDPSKVLPSGAEIAEPVLKQTGEYVPTSTAGKIGMGAVEAGTSMLGGGSGAVSRDAGAGLDVAMKLLTNSAKQAPLGAVAGAVGTGVTEATGDPLLGMAAGFAAPAVAGAAGHTAVNKGRQFLKIGQNERELEVGQKLRDTATPETDVEKQLMVNEQGPLNTQLVPGSQPKTGEFTANRGMLDADRRAMNEPVVPGDEQSGNIPFLQRAQEQEQARRAAMKSQSGTGDAAAVPNLFRDQLETLQKSGEEAIDRIRASAQEFANRLGPGELPEQRGAAIRDAAHAAEQEIKKATSALYAAVDPDKSLNAMATPIKARAKELLAERDPTVARPLEGEEARLFGLITSLPDVVPFDSLRQLDTRVTGAMREAKRAADPAYGRLAQLKGAVMDAINNAVEHQTAYEQVAVQAGKLAPENTISARLGELHDEYHGNLGHPAGEPRAATGTDGAAPETGLFDVRGAEGAGGRRSGDAAGAAGVQEAVPSLSINDIRDIKAVREKYGDAAADKLRSQLARNAETTVYYPGGNLRAKYEVVDLPSLKTSHDTDFNLRKDYPQELQPRARESAPARDQVNGMAAKLQPERLGRSPEANSGAPIVGPDNVVESGNGRTLAIAKAYEKGNTTYRQWLESQGYDTKGMKQPVLVARRTSEMTPQQREFFTQSANSSSSLRMNAAEQAAADAKVISPQSLSLLTEAPIRALENRDFVRSFVDKLPATERGGILDKDGNLSQAGIKRVEAALASRAYGDSAFVGRAFDSADSNIRNLAGAMVDAAGPWARMREAAREGVIDGSHDITTELMDVVRKVMRARDEGTPVADVLKQTDMFGSDVAPLVQSLLFRNVENGALASRKRIASGLSTYATEAEKNLAGPRLFGDDVKPRDVFKTAIGKAAADVDEAPPTFETGAKEPVIGPKPLEPNMTAEAGQRLREAKDKYIERKETFQNARIKPVLATEGGANDFKMLDSAVPARAVVRSDKGYETAKEFLAATKGEPKAVLAMVDHLLDPLRGTALTKEGTINPKAFAKWKEEYEGAIRALDEASPGFAKQFESGAKATEVLSKAGEIAKQRLDDFHASDAAKFLNAQEPSEVQAIVMQMLTDKKAGPTRVRNLIDQAKDSPDALAGIRKAAVDGMIEKLSGVQQNGTSGEKQLKPGQLQKFVSDNRATMDAVFSPQTVNLFNRIAKDVERSQLVTSTMNKASPNTAKDLGGMFHRAMEKAGEHKSIAHAMAAAFGYGIGHGGIKGAAIATALAVPAYVTQSLRSAGIKSINDMYRDALLNPERARYYLGVQREKSAESGPLYALTRSLRRELIAQPALLDYERKKKVARKFGGPVRAYAGGGAAFGTESPAEAADNPNDSAADLWSLISGAGKAGYGLIKHAVDASAGYQPGLRREDYTDVPPPDSDPHSIAAQVGIKSAPTAWTPAADVVGAATEAALATMGGGAAGVEKNAAGIFGGRLAANADLEALRRAEDMALSGVDRAKIWNDTGWFKGADDKWRFEIPDQNARLGKGAREELETKGESSGPVAGQIWHQELYDAYPELRRMTGITKATQGEGQRFGKEGSVGMVGGHFDESVPLIEARSPGPDPLRSVLLHELQHAVQTKEGFTPGSNPGMFTDQENVKTVRDALSFKRELDQLPKGMDRSAKENAIVEKYRELGAVDWLPSRQARDLALSLNERKATELQGLIEAYGADKRTTPLSPSDMYKRVAGEVEARNVQYRRDFTDDTRKKYPPWITEEFPHEEQRVLSQDGRSIVLGSGPTNNYAAALLDVFAGRAKEKQD